MVQYTLFIFRRDLRIIDNTALIKAAEYGNVIPIFIFTPEQIKNNPYASDNAIQFMCESLVELDSDLKKNGSRLHIFNGDNISVLKKIIKTINVNAIVFNMDYTPYAKKRDNEIAKFCSENNIECIMPQDYLLFDIGTLNKANGDAYTVFTPFRNNGMKKTPRKPNNKRSLNLVKASLPTTSMIQYSNNPHILKGGREAAVKQLDKISNQKNYNETRNTMAIDTSLLSAYIKFGNISIREVYWKAKDMLGSKNELLSQLFWREFYFYIAHYFPYVLNGENYVKKYNKIKWKTSKSELEKWEKGETGYPVVDAGMRQLNMTGYMHNRARLITANFLNRMLGHDWREGEKYYATKLTDYDPAVNNGNWQWIASTGVDPKPYFQRLFNPWLQSKKFDGDAEYIKRWLPQLKDIPSDHLHQWDKYCDQYDLKKIDYYKPIVDYKEARKKSVQMYRSAL